MGYNRSVTISAKAKFGNLYFLIFRNKIVFKGDFSKATAIRVAEYDVVSLKLRLKGKENIVPDNFKIQPIQSLNSVTNKCYPTSL